MLLEDLYSKCVSAVKLDGELTEWFKVVVGARQGCNLSPYLFLLLLEAIMQLALQNTEAGVHMDGQVSQVVNNLRFADDIDLIAESETDQQELTDKVNCYSKKLGLRINEKKTQVMAVGKTDTKVNIWLDGGRLDQVKKFTYLGSLMTDDGKCIMT